MAVRQGRHPQPGVSNKGKGQAVLGNCKLSVEVWGPGCHTWGVHRVGFSLLSEGTHWNPIQRLEQELVENKIISSLPSHLPAFLSPFFSSSSSFFSSSSSSFLFQCLVYDPDLYHLPCFIFFTSRQRLTESLSCQGWI